MQQQTGEHAPRDLVAAALAGDVAAVELDDFRRARRDPRHPRPQRDAVVPIADPGDNQQAPRAPQGARNEIAAGGVLAAPGARRHPVVHAAVTVRAGILEVIVAPRLGPPAPGAEPHRIHHATAAAPVAAGVELESLRRLQRLVTRAAGCSSDSSSRSAPARYGSGGSAARVWGLRACSSCQRLVYDALNECVV